MKNIDKPKRMWYTKKIVAQINNMKGCEIKTEENFNISSDCIYV